MIKKAKNRIWVLFLFLLIIAISGCDLLQKDGKDGSTDFKRGAEGLVMEFVKNYPGDRYLVEVDEDILIIVDVKNKGTYPTDSFDEGNIYLSGFDDGIINRGEKGADDKYIKMEKSKSLSEMFLPGASSINPLGGFDAAEFEGKIVAGQLRIDEYNPIILATACYPYFTKSSPTVCIDPFPFDDRQEKVCNIGSQSVPSQGAPVAITRIDQEASTGKIQFKINIKNVGDGDVLKPGVDDDDIKILDKCSPLGGGILNRKDFDRVQLEKVQIGNVDLLESRRCSPFADGTKGTTNLIRLFNGEGFVICTLTVKELGDVQSAYTTPIQVELKYSYRSTISKQIEIEKFTGIGSTPGTDTPIPELEPMPPDDELPPGDGESPEQKCDELGVEDEAWKCITDGNTPAKTCVGDGAERVWSLSSRECGVGGQCYESQIVGCDEDAGEVCSASTNGCGLQPSVFAPTIVPSSFISHNDGSVDLILDTPDNTFCKIDGIQGFSFLQESNFDTQGTDCKNLDDADYSTSTLTIKHQCSIISNKIRFVETGAAILISDNKFKVGCMEGSFVDGTFEKIDGTFEKVNLAIESVTRDGGTITSMDLKYFEEDSTFSITNVDPPPIKITVLKGPGTVGGDGVVEHDLIWETDRNTACRAQEIQFSESATIPGIADGTQHSSEIASSQGDGSVLYIGCKDIDDLFNSELFVIDKLPPVKINNLEVIPEKEGSMYKMNLTWIAPGDARNSIKQYHVRANKDTLIVSNWNHFNSIKLEGDVYNDPPDPLSKGEPVTFVTKSAFEPDTRYFFAVRSEDSVGNIAVLSNVKEVQTGD